MSEKLSPFDIAKNINEKQGLLENDEIASSYNGWMINKVMSMTSDTVLFANEMNMNYHLDKDMQYVFFYQGLNKKKRYGKWQKKDKLNGKDSEVSEYLKTKYCYSEKRASEILDLLSKKDIELLRQEFSTGGLSSNRK